MTFQIIDQNHRNIKYKAGKCVLSDSYGNNHSDCWSIYITLFMMLFVVVTGNLQKKS